MSIARSPRAATIRCTSGSPKPGMGAKGIVAIVRGLGVLLAGRHRRHHSRLAHARCRMAIAPKKFSSRSKSFSRLVFAASLRKSPLVLVADALPARSFRTWPSRSRPICASRCQSGKARMPGVEEMKLAVMGCVVNGPGESKHANIGISLPGTFEEPKAPVYVDGRCSQL